MAFVRTAFGQMAGHPELIPVISPCFFSKDYSISSFTDYFFFSKIIIPSIRTHAGISPSISPNAAIILSDTVSEIPEILFSEFLQEFLSEIFQRLFDDM